MKNLRTLALPFLALMNAFVSLVAPVSVRPVLTGPSMAYLGSKVAFLCYAPNSSVPVSYELMWKSDVVIDASADQEQPASFLVKVTETSGGSYHCTATAEGSTKTSNSIKLTVVIPPSDTRVTSEPSPPVIYEGSHITLSCVVMKGSHLSYTWLFNRNRVTSSSSYLFNLTGNKLAIERATPEHAGNYSCMAWSSVPDVSRFSSSMDFLVTVKVYVSKPKISFSIFKEGDSYRGNVTCWSLRGSPPINFSLSIDDKEVGLFTATGLPIAWFSVAVVPGLDMGDARCRAKTEMQEMTSDAVTLEVVPVGGEAKVEVEHLYSADSQLAATKLTCEVSRGTFPYVSWLFNDSVLPAETRVQSHFDASLPHYVLTDHRRTLVLTTHGPEESGYYYCWVRDSYDEAGPWVKSAAVLVQVTEVLINSVELITIVFCCFLLLMLAVGAACVYLMFGHRQVLANTTVTNSDALPLPALSSQLEDNQAGASSTQCDIQNQNQSVEIAL